MLSEAGRSRGDPFPGGAPAGTPGVAPGEIRRAELARIIRGRGELHRIAYARRRAIGGADRSVPGALARTSVASGVLFLGAGCGFSSKAERNSAAL